MEALMKEKIFGIRVERLLLNCQQTLYMVGWALLIGTLVGAVLALLLVLTRKGGVRENPVVYAVISAYINVVRSVPFVILLVAIMPLTRAIIGPPSATRAALVPLVVYIRPYLARLMKACWRSAPAYRGRQAMAPPPSRSSATSLSPRRWPPSSWR